MRKMMRRRPLKKVENVKKSFLRRLLTLIPPFLAQCFGEVSDILDIL